jgi:EVE domain-containing protein
MGQRNYWIFQSRPDRFDLRNSDSIVPGNTELWDATRYRAYMQPGDIVFLWLSGEPEWRGIYGWGELASVPYAEGTADDFGVAVRYVCKLIRPLLANKLWDSSLLTNLQIKKIAVGTNFLINEVEARAIADLIRQQNDIAPEI